MLRKDFAENYCEYCGNPLDLFGLCPQDCEEGMAEEQYCYNCGAPLDEEAYCTNEECPTLYESCPDCGRGEYDIRERCECEDTFCTVCGEELNDDGVCPACDLEGESEF